MTGPNPKDDPASPASTPGASAPKTNAPPAAGSSTDRPEAATSAPKPSLADQSPNQRSPAGQPSAGQSSAGQTAVGQSPIGGSTTARFASARSSTDLASTNRSTTDASPPEPPQTTSTPSEDPRPSSQSSSRPRIWPRVVGVLILLLGVGGAWIWQDPGLLERSLGVMFPGKVARETGMGAMKVLEARVGRLEEWTKSADPRSLLIRIDALEARATEPAIVGSQSGPGAIPMPSVQSASGQDLARVLARIDALEARAKDAGTSPPAGPEVAPGYGPLLARLDRLEKAVADHAVTPGKIDALGTRVEALSAGEPTADLRGRLDAVEHQLSGLTASEGKTAEATGRVIRLARLEAAAIALAAGRPLGVVPDAPPALTKFAATSPPTDAALRLAFPAASRAALKVSLPDTEGKPFLDRILARLRGVGLITVREGDRVVIGNSAAATLAHAQLLLEVGDLAGAVKTVGSLSGPPADAMAPWLADATSLVAAREALVSLASNG